MGSGERQCAGPERSPNSPYPKNHEDYMAAASLIPFAERHYTPIELGALWGLHGKTVRELFKSEQGVRVLGNAKTIRYRKAYTTLRIPASVAERVHRRLQQN